MSALDAWRREVRALIPRGFLRRDAGEDAVLVSDYPRWEEAGAVTERLRAAGYAVEVREGLAHIDGSREKYLRLFSALPCPEGTPTDETLYAFSLARRLIAADVSLEEQPLFLLGQWMKRLDGGDQRVIPVIAAHAALCLRRKQPLPSAAGKLILCALFDSEQGGTPSC